MVKEDHILKLELKQVVKKLKEDPRNVLMWEEQDQADQKKISKQNKKISFNIKKQETKISPNLRDAALNQSSNKKKKKSPAIRKSKWWKLLQEEEAWYNFTVISYQTAKLTCYI